MPQIDNHLNWCLKDTRRLVKVKPDPDLAQKHVKKSEYNYNVMQFLFLMRCLSFSILIYLLQKPKQCKSLSPGQISFSYHPLPEKPLSLFFAFNWKTHPV